MDAPTLPANFLLTGDHYVNPRWTPLEQSHIFHKTWLFVGDAKTLAPGQAQALTIADRPLLITCSSDGTLQAFYNICPHRAALLCPEGSIKTCDRLVCPYHAWSYNLDGQLQGLPGRKRFGEPLDFRDFALKPVRLETWSDFIFVCFSGDPPDLHTFLAPIPEELGQHRQPTSQFLFTRSHLIHCNWKNYHDNTLCDYHVAIAHRQTLHQIQGPVTQYRHLFDQFTNALITPLPQAWLTQNKQAPQLSAQAAKYLYTFGIFPNLHLFAFPDGLLVWLHIEPLTSETCRVVIAAYGDPACCPPIDLLKQDFAEFMSEDIALVESVQKGYASEMYIPGPVNQL
ncbi:MAG: aromatic ring-hydroxylating dioxygenase subunit alpha, partial [Cyanobacteria bacterium P01_H01_bin.15]